jgi:hypothetical protein
VPKAAVNKNGEPVTPEEEIGLAGQGSVSAPACDAMPTQKLHQHQLSRPVPATAHRTHDLGAFRHRNGVGTPRH